ncbi:MAG: sortase [Candidatus Humimicrobiaceae bacterium]
METKRKKRSTSSIVFLIIIILLFIGGISLIFYPFITSIPSFFQRSSHIESWESIKSSSSISQNSAASQEEVSQTTVDPEDSGLLPQTEVNEQEAQSQSSTSTTQPAEAEIILSNENIKYSATDIFPAKLTIPKINIEWITDEGSDIPDLKKGPGHIPQTPLPGEEGRSTLSGHRTTYGAPFNRIDELVKGDLIYLEALNGNKYFYRVTSFQIVKPTFVEILEGTDKKELLLTTCFPEYSARERLIIIAELINIFPLDLNLK